MEIHPPLELSEPAWLYLLYDASGQLLYVGIAGDFEKRFSQHRLNKHWWPQVARKDVTWYEFRIDAAYEEARVIREEHPLYNKAPGIDQLALAVIRERYSEPSWPPVDERQPQPMMVTSVDEADRIIKRVPRHGVHAVVTVDGIPVGTLVPPDWYEAACSAIGDPVDLDALAASDPTEF